MDEYVTSVELAHKFRCNRRTIGWLRKYGLIQGIRTGKGYIFNVTSVKEFFDKNLGEDLSNEQKIRIVSIKKDRTNRSGKKGVII